MCTPRVPLSVSLAALRWASRPFAGHRASCGLSETVQEAKPACGPGVGGGGSSGLQVGSWGSTGRKYSRTVEARAPCTYQNKHVITCLEWMSFMVRKSHLNKAVPSEGTEKESCRLDCCEEHCLSAASLTWEGSYR